MIIDFSGTMPKVPELALRAKIAWEYYFGGSGETLRKCVRTENDGWIVTDSDRNLDEALLFQSTDDFIRWLSEETERLLREEPKKLLGQFLPTDELVTEKLVQAVREAAGIPEKGKKKKK